MLWRDLQWLSKEASRLDSLFKRIHARVRIHAESIAFYGGGGAEREFAERQFDQVLKHERRVQWMKFKLGWAQQIFDARIPEILKNRYAIALPCKTILLLSFMLHCFVR
eukprot:COSAG06_NODE_1480_length_9321_cov_14.755042_2_plen_109_part_00